MRRLLGKLRSTYRWHPGAAGVPYWQVIIAWVLVALVLLSLAIYVFSDPSWGVMLVLGVLVGAVVLGNSANSNAPVTPRTERTKEEAAQEFRRAATVDESIGIVYATVREVEEWEERRTEIEQQPVGLAAKGGLLARIEAARAEPPLCTAHPDCGPVTRIGHSGHGHGPSETSGLWCWHFDESWLGRPDEEAPEGSDLAARRAQQAELYEGNPFVHKTYPTAQ